MSVAICGDIHFGSKIGDENFFNYQNQSFDRMVDYCIQKQIKTIIFLGDIFNHRTTINFFVLDHVIKKFNRISKIFDNIIIVVGNHDVFYKNTNRLNSPNVIFNSLFSDDLKKKIKIIYEKPEELTYDGSLFLMLPWITKDNFDTCIESIKNSTSKYCMGHLEINGFLMNSKIKCEGGLKASTFKNFNRVFSGHFHTRSRNKNIIYTGSMTQLTWNDYNDKKGFYVLDSKTGKEEFVQLNDDIFIKLIINEKTNVEDMLYVKNSYIKIYINRKLTSIEQKIITQILLNNIKHEVIDNTIIEDNVDLKIEDESTDVIIKEVVQIQENIEPKDKKNVYRCLMSAHNNVLVEGN